MRGPETTEDAFFSLPLDSSAHHLHLSPALTTFARVFDFGLAFDLRAPAPVRSDLRPEGVMCPLEGCVGFCKRCLAVARDNREAECVASSVSRAMEDGRSFSLVYPAGGYALSAVLLAELYEQARRPLLLLPFLHVRALRQEDSLPLDHEPRAVWKPGPDVHLKRPMLEDRTASLARGWQSSRAGKSLLPSCFRERVLSSWLECRLCKCDPGDLEGPPH